MRRPRPKFKVSFYLYFCCFWINVTQINFKNIKRKLQRIISDSWFQLKSWFNVDARAPSIPLLNFPFNYHQCFKLAEQNWLIDLRFCNHVFAFFLLFFFLQSYIHGSSQGQFVAETHIVILLRILWDTSNHTHKNVYMILDFLEEDKRKYCHINIIIII